MMTNRQFDYYISYSIFFNASRHIAIWLEFIIDYQFLTLRQNYGSANQQLHHQT